MLNPGYTDHTTLKPTRSVGSSIISAVIFQVSFSYS